MMRIITLLLFALIISGCSTTEKPIEADITNVSSKADKNLHFEISDFSMDYESGNSSFNQEEYTGNGIITVSGDKDLIKKTYLVYLSVKKVSGGAPSDKETGIRLVMVSNGIGKFVTNDYNFEESMKLIKPIYEFKIVGYTMAEEYDGKVVTSN